MMTTQLNRAIRQRQDLQTASDLDRRMNDLAAAELYEQILLGCVRAGINPNEKSAVEEYEGYVAPSFDPVRGARVAAEQRAHYAEVYREREEIIYTLRSLPQHQQLSAFDRLLTETEYWTGVREWTGSGNSGRRSQLRRRHLKEAAAEGEREGSVGSDMLHITETPSYIKGKLRPYQIEGVNWLLGLFSRSINGILADEMGLGKTLQTIATVAYLKFTYGLPGPYLVVCPKSVMGNWYRELKQWCPALSAYRFHGPSDIRPQLIKSHLQPYEKVKYDVIVTTFEMVLDELPTFKRIHWQYLIVDEAHKLKNEESRAHTALDSLNTNHRLIITGTPLQNNLKELWALLHFLVPRLFEDASCFDAWFDTASGQQDSNAMSNMHKILAPLMIRRLKSEVSTGIPPKKEIYVSCRLTKTQRKWYMHVLAKDAGVLNKISGGSMSTLTNIMMNLRKVINHPYMMDGGEEGPPFVTDERIVKHSGKMIILDKLLHRLLQEKEAKHKVLIFSQFTTMLDILEDYCGMRGFKVCRIDGNTSGYDRDAQMAAFNSPNSDYFIFLLSTRAGGLGINLQAANHVVIYDSDWNPQMDLQAQDRAHRIGQKRVVRIYRFVTDGTVEEKIYRRALKKLYLDAMVVQHGRIQQNSGGNVSKEELLSMIKFGAEELFKAKDEDITEADIDQLFDGEEKSREVTSAIKEQIQMSLASFKLGAEEANVYDFEGVSFKSGVESRILHLTLATPVSQDELYRQCSQHGEVTKVVLHPNLTEALAFFRTTSGAIEAKDNLPYRCQFASKEAQTVVPTELITEYLGATEKLGRGHRVREVVHQYTEEDVRRLESAATKAPPLRIPKFSSFPSYQLYNVKRLQELHTKEVALMVQNWKRKNEISDADGEKNRHQQQPQYGNEAKRDGIQTREENNNNNNNNTGKSNECNDMFLSALEQEERERLLGEGFPNWTHHEYRSLVNALASGAYDVTDYPELALAIGSTKTAGEVRDYVTALFERGSQCIKNFSQVEERIKRSQEKRKMREDELRAAKWKVESYEHPESQLAFGGRAAHEFDRRLFLIGYDAGFRMENMGRVIKSMPEYRFNAWCQSRSDMFFERRMRALMRAVKKEWDRPNDPAMGPPQRRRKL